MQKIGLILLFIMTVQSGVIFDFNKNSNTTNWTIVNDAVMGGKSEGNFNLNEDGNGVFSGNVSLENNGGFSMLRYRFNKINTAAFSKIVLRVKGDTKAYQFRVKTKVLDNHSYINTFNTTDDWQTIEIPLYKMYPAFRGKKLDIPNYANDGIEEIAFLIGNKKAEGFVLIIDKVVLK